MLDAGAHVASIAARGKCVTVDGEHIFELEAHQGGTRFVQREEFRGVLVTPLLAWVGKSTLAGFKQMNEALKERAEARL